MSTVALGGAEGTWVRYWDETSTVAVLEFKVEEPPQTIAQAKEKKEKKRSKSKYAFYTSQSTPFYIVHRRLRERRKSYTRATFSPASIRQTCYFELQQGPSETQHR